MTPVGFIAAQQRIAEIQARFDHALPQPAAAPGFSGVFKSALGDAGVRGTAGPAHAHPAPPPELAQYGNGRIPPAALTEIGQGRHRLWEPAADAYRRLREDARLAGVDIGVTDSYRSYDQQVDLARRKGLYAEGGLAATPGTSDHGWGLSLDLDLDPRAQAWMRANAGRHGFVEDVPREPWHWTFHGHRPPGLTGGTAGPRPRS
jgi:hypothetical protein